MKVAVYSAKKYDVESLEKYSDGDLSLEFFEPKLEAKTVPLATGCEAVCIFVNDSCNAEVLDELQKIGVKFVALRCAGFNNVDTKKAREIGIKVVRVPAYSPSSIAEFAVGLMMTVVRKYHKAYNRVREGNFLLDGLVGFNLGSKTIGIIGTGKIGLLIGNILAKGYGCKVIAYDLYPNPKAAAEHGMTYVDSLDELLAQSDIISLHCPLADSTHHMINDESLKKTKKGVVLVNTSRGGLIDTRALIRALKSGHMGAVALDVYEGESEYFFADSSSKIIEDDMLARLNSFYNVFISGHQAFLTEEALGNIAETTVQSLKDLVSLGCSVNEVMA